MRKLVRGVFTTANIVDLDYNDSFIMHPTSHSEIAEVVMIPAASQRLIVRPGLGLPGTEKGAQDGVRAQAGNPPVSVCGG
jgi:hypothetical protein